MTNVVSAASLSRIIDDSFFLPAATRKSLLQFEDVIEGDTDIQVTEVTWYTASFSWYTNYTTSTSRYELYCSPLNESERGFNRTIILDSTLQDYTIKDLKPSVRYQAWVMNYLASGINQDNIDVLRSNRVEFTTDQVPAEIAQTLILSQAVDVILVLCLLACWVSACFVFYKQWSSFHLQLPNKYTHYKNLPKGLENIKVIKRAQDSVIYRNPNRSMSIKITERNRKLARMHTSPGALVGIQEHNSQEDNDIVDAVAPPKRGFKRRTTALT